MKFIKSIISVVVACSVLLGLCTVSYASSVNSAADGIYLDGSNIIADTGTTVTKTDNAWTVEEELTAENTSMEFSIKALLPIAGTYRLSIVSGQGASVALNGEAISLPSPSEKDGIYTYTIRDAKFKAGTNEIKFSVSGDAGTKAAFTLYSVKIAHPATTVTGQEFSKHTCTGIVGTRWYPDSNESTGDFNYMSYGSTETPFYAEYKFYVPEDGEYSLTGIMSFPEGSENGEAKWFSQCNIVWDGFEGSYDVTSTVLPDTTQFGTSVYKGIMLDKGIHTLRIIPTIATSLRKYNLNVGQLTLAKTGEYAQESKTIEIMGNEYSSMGGMSITDKNDLTLVSTQETFADWKFAKSGMTSTDTDTVTYSFDVSKAGYYSFEGWMNTNNNQWVSASVVELDDTVLTLNEDNTVTTNSKDEGIYITKKTVPSTNAKIWLNEGTHKLEVILSPTKASGTNPSINARIWKLTFNLISDGDIYIPAQNYVGESAVAPTIANTTIGETAVEYCSFKDDKKTDVFTLTYKFTPEFTSEYSFEGWASKVATYLSKPIFKLNGTQIDTKEDTTAQTSDTYVTKHTASGIALTAGTEYTLTVEFQPKENGGNINAKLWKMELNRVKNEKDRITEQINNNTMTGSFYVEPQEQAKSAYIIYAQYDEKNRLDDVTVDTFELKQSNMFSAASFAIDLPADYDSAPKSKVFVMTTDLYPLFDALELK